MPQVRRLLRGWKLRSVAKLDGRRAREVDGGHWRRLLLRGDRQQRNTVVLAEFWGQSGRLMPATHVTRYSLIAWGCVAVCLEKIIHNRQNSIGFFILFSYSTGTASYSLLTRGATFTIMWQRIFEWKFHCLLRFCWILSASVYVKCRWTTIGQKIQALSTTYICP